MKPGAIIILICIIALLGLTLFCVRKTISDDREVQEEYEKKCKPAQEDNAPAMD